MEPTRTLPPLPPAVRQVSLPLRQWAWLSAQPRRASATLRRLVDEARQDRDGRFEREAARERCYFLMRDLAGDSQGFEDACRALYAGELARFAAILSGWPEDVRHPIEALAVRVWPCPVDGSERP